MSLGHPTEPSSRSHFCQWLCFQNIQMFHSPQILDKLCATIPDIFFGLWVKHVPIFHVIQTYTFTAHYSILTEEVIMQLFFLNYIVLHAESPSDTALLVDLIFQTLPIYDDRASRKAVDDMVIQALGEPTFMKPIAAALVQSMEKNLKVTNPLTSFKLLRWSHFLLKWSQFATLSKGAFSRLANAQAVLCQVLMNGSFRRRRTCKELFIHLFSEVIVNNK